MCKLARLALSALVLLATGAFLLPLVASATTWNPPYDLGGGGTKPSVAVDSAGGLHYVWWEPTAKVIQYTFCTGPAESDCGRVETLPNNGAASYYPNIAIDPADRPNVVWESRDGSSYSIFWAQRENGQWSAAKKISREPYSELPDIAIGSQGIVHVVYQSKQDNTGYVYYVESDDGFATLRSTELEAAPSDLPIPAAADTSEAVANPEGGQLTNGLFPRVATDASDRAHIVWNAPSPYGVYYSIQQATGDFASKLTVSTGHKDQSADVTVSPGGAVGILWGTYDNFNAAFAEYDDGRRDLRQYDVDGGIAQSLWPRVDADCSGLFHFVFQGKVTTDGNWNVYHRTYDAATNTFGKRETIASTGGQEQTPDIAVAEVGAVAFTDTSRATARGSTALLDVNCGGAPTATATATLTGTPTATNTIPAGATPTHTFTPTDTPTNTPTATDTEPAPPTSTQTPTDTATATDQPTAAPSPTATDHSPGGAEHIPATDPRITYTGEWKEYHTRAASDKSYMRCGGKKKCASDWSASITFTGGRRVQWETIYANTYGKARVLLDGELYEQVDLCKMRPRSSNPKFATRTYVLTGDANTAHTLQIVAFGRSDCSDYRSAFVGVDGFNVLR